MSLAESAGWDITVAPTLDDVLRNTKVVGSAITSQVDLSSAELDLSGVHIIDDSQPGAFAMEQVHELGGTLQWVVGADNSANGVFTRSDGFTYGTDGLAKTGL